MSMECNPGRRENGGLVVVVKGNIDAAASGDFSEAVGSAARDESVSKLVLDMTGVGYIASAGLRVVLIAIKTLHSRKGELVIVGAKGDVENTLRMTGILKLVRQSPSVDEALT